MLGGHFALVDNPGSAHHGRTGLVFTSDDERTCAHNNWTVPSLTSDLHVHVMFDNLETIAIEERMLRPAARVSFAATQKQHASRSALHARDAGFERVFDLEPPRDRSYTSWNAFVEGTASGEDHASSRMSGFDALVTMPTMF